MHTGYFSDFNYGLDWKGCAGGLKNQHLATCETRQVLLAGVSGGFPGVLPFRPPIDWLVSMSEIILKGTLN